MAPQPVFRLVIYFAVTHQEVQNMTRLLQYCMRLVAVPMVRELTLSPVQRDSLIHLTRKIDVRNVKLQLNAWEICFFCQEARCHSTYIS